MKIVPHRLAAVLVLTVAAGAALAADTSPAPAAAPDPLATVRSLIAAEQWRGAVEELKRVNQPQSADWNNLMGYSLRKSKTPDLAGAEAHYNAALKIDPKHRGALEYSGEMYLMKGDLASAEQRLAALDKICMLPCAEFTDLKKAIAAYKDKTTAGK